MPINLICYIFNVWFYICLLVSYIINNITIRNPNILIRSDSFTQIVSICEIPMMSLALFRNEWPRLVLFNKLMQWLNISITVITSFILFLIIIVSICQPQQSYWRKLKYLNFVPVDEGAMPMLFRRLITRFTHRLILCACFWQSGPSALRFEESYSLLKIRFLNCKVSCESVHRHIRAVIIQRWVECVLFIGFGRALISESEAATIVGCLLTSAIALTLAKQNQIAKQPIITTDLVMMAEVRQLKSLVCSA